MKILYIAPAFQHPAVRGSTRCYHFIRELSKRHRISLLTLARSEIKPEAMQEMADYGETIAIINATGNGEDSNGRNGGFFFKLKGQFHVELQSRSAIKKMKNDFLNLVAHNSFDVILFHGKSVFPVIQDWDELPIVVDFCDATSMRVRQSMRYARPVKRLFLVLRYLQIRRTERRLINKSPHLAFISSRDRDAILSHQNGAKVVPIGVDSDFWRRKTHAPLENCLVFTGVMNYAPNEDAALHLIKDILPKVRQVIPDIKLLIVGREPSATLREKAKSREGVTVTGYVDDVRTYLERATLFVAPLRYGSGIQNKVLEAMAMEVPVISTPIVAAGLRFDGYGDPPLHVADDAVQFADKIISLLSQKGEQARLASEGRKFVQEHFNWAHNAQALESLCVEAVLKAKNKQELTAAR